MDDLSPEQMNLLLPVVFAGGFAQSAAGVGFGAVAGPLLLLAHGYERGVAETAVFSLMAAVVGTAHLAKYADRRATTILCLTLVPGVLLGVAGVAVLSPVTVMALFGFMLVAFSLSMVRGAMGPASVIASAEGADRAIACAGVLAGAGAFLFSAPGPAAAWGVSRLPLAPGSVRGTLAVYLVLAYVAVLAVFAAAGSFARINWIEIGWMGLVCVAGAAAGLALSDRMSGRATRLAMGSIVGTAGLSILVTLAWRTM